MIGAWFCSQDYAARNASVVQRFADSIRQSAIYTNAHPADTVSLLADYSHVDPALIKTMHRLQSATSIDPAAIQRIVDAAFKYGLIDKTFPAADLV
jgi:ABC-type nitrate/sulfonate/bicarbonate transport system substrate-binding protein